MSGRLGRYELLARLGAGGTAEVWRARLDGVSGFSRDVVLKRLRPELARDREFVTRLRKEARIVARLSHSNIVQVYEVFEASGETVLVMEHVRGCDLLELLRTHGVRGTRMPVGMAAYVAREAARGLASAHAHRDENGAPMPVVHRDVNPANVMLGADGSVRVIDFGFAKVAEDRAREQTATGVLFGKAGYFAPELLADVGRRTSPDPRCDQFALGVVLHEMLTGERLVRAHSHDKAWSPAPPPSQQRPEVPELLDRVCLRMMETDRDARYASCQEVVESLDRVTQELGFGSLQAGAHVEAMGLANTTAPAIDSGRETEDAGAAINADTIVDDRSPAFVRRRSSRRRASAASLAVVLLALGFAWTHARHAPARATTALPAPAVVPPATQPTEIVAPRAEPTVAVAEVTVVPPTHVPTRPVRPKRVVTSARPPRHAAPTSAPPPSFEVTRGAVYDPFK